METFLFKLVFALLIKLIGANLICDNTKEPIEVVNKTLNMESCSNIWLNLPGNREDIQIIVAANNLIDSIQSRDLEEATNLKELHLMSNKIHEISCHAFLDQSNLKYLDLRLNKLRRLNPGVFDPLVQLQNLYLDYNELTVLEMNLFAKNAELQTITLYSNKIVSVAASSFASLQNTTQLTFFGNQCGPQKEDYFLVETFYKEFGACIQSYNKKAFKYCCNCKCTEQIKMINYTFMVSIAINVVLLFLISFLIFCCISMKRLAKRNAEHHEKRSSDNKRVKIDY